MPEYITDPVPEEIAKHCTTVHSLNLLVLRCGDFEASVFFYTAIGLRFQNYEMGKLMGADSSSRIIVAKAVVPGPHFALMPDDEEVKLPCIWLELQPAGKKPATSGLVLGLFVKSVVDGLRSGIAAGASCSLPRPIGRTAAVLHSRTPTGTGLGCLNRR
jgi:hypothetical protein